ncbi:BrnA antitoxin family protein [Bordetella sp. N]|uniref:BrnA antitoxin family protein n=1 Tax=Bordetella sp. N TaxID=1746199 RepID=UPI00070A544A|nr:BrnA antitoxin family protein [Bordetella sp. N]ALM83012.1 hypothetical protein ASB57_08635 [Bordetella sp. N]
MPKKVDPEIAAFEASVLRGLDQALNGQYARVSKPADIVARRAGRPVGSKAEVHKVATTIRFDPEVLEGFKATGRGWQTRINDILKDWLRQHQPG